MRILIISSLSPYSSANHGKRLIDTFEDAGYEVDYLTKYRFDGMTETMYSVYDEKEPTIPAMTVSSKTSLRYYIYVKFPFIRRYYEKKEISQSVIRLNEEDPEVDAALLCKKITKQYDVVFVSFWQYMLTTKTLKMIYEKLHVPIFLYTVDMYPMTGGCYYFNDCHNYKNECLNCPAAKKFSNPEIPHNNFLYKKDVYNSINCIYFCNNWMKEHVVSSGIIPIDRIRHYLNSGNQSFKLDKTQEELRKEFELPLDKFIIFAGAANIRHRRKGFYELVSAINFFAKKRKIRKNTILVLAGRNKENFQKFFKVKVLHFGFLPTDKLEKMYGAADLYLSPSIDDAGPSMVNQSLRCGTPVVAFNMGVAPEVIEQKQTGYIAKLGDVKDFSCGIRFFYDLDKKQREAISLKCRNTTTGSGSTQTFITSFEQLYAEFKDKNI